MPPELMGKFYGWRATSSTCGRALVVADIPARSLTSFKKKLLAGRAAHRTANLRSSAMEKIKSVTGLLGPR